MKWKIMALTALTAACLAGSAGAYDMNQVAAKALPKQFAYQDIAGEQTLSFMGQEIPYQMGQLQITLKKQQRFASGYIIRGELPVAMADVMKPYFKMNRDEKVWQQLTRMNRALLNPDSPLRKSIEETMLTLAENSLGPVARSAVTVDISNVEPFRRLTSDEAYVYTAGGLITYNAEGMLLPMYCRAYFFPSDSALQVMMLFTPDEGKAPLLYAIDDLANEAAKESLMGTAGYQDLGMLLAPPAKES